MKINTFEHNLNKYHLDVCTSAEHRARVPVRRPSSPRWYVPTTNIDGSIGENKITSGSSGVLMLSITLKSVISVPLLSLPWSQQISRDTSVRCVA